MELIKKQEACEILSISMNTLEKLIREGRIPAYRIAEKSIRLSREDLQAYLEARRTPQSVAMRRRQTAPARKCEYYPGMKVV